MNVPKYEDLSHPESLGQNLLRVALCKLQESDEQMSLCKQTNKLIDDLPCGVSFAASRATEVATQQRQFNSQKGRTEPAGCVEAPRFKDYHETSSVGEETSRNTSKPIFG